VVDAALQESAAAAFCIRLATQREVQMFVDRVLPHAPAIEILEAHVALIGNEIVAVGLLRIDGDRLFGHLNVADGAIPPRLGLMILRYMRGLMRGLGRPVYTYPATHLYGEKPNRLLAYLGFGEQ
jgi:hypothetical protein